MISLDSLIDFIHFTHEFRKVERVARAPGETRWENDAEHSYQLALTAWYLIESNKLDLDIALVLKYALAHDLVEVYAGDTYFLDHDKKGDKEERERAALKQIEGRFPSFGSLRPLIEAYEQRADTESRFVYALDKMLPVVQAYMENGKVWRETKLPFREAIKNKDERIAVSPELMPYWNELRSILLEKESELFSETKQPAV